MTDARPARQQVASRSEAGPTVTRLLPRLPDEAFQDLPGIAAPPGYYLREVLVAQNVSQSQLASRTGLSTKHVNQVAQGLAPLSPETALLLERALGVPSHVWNALEAAHQEVQAREVSKQHLGTHQEWLKRFPLKELHSKRIVTPSADTATQVGQLLAFFQVADPDAYDRVWSGPVAAGFRRTKGQSVDPYATATWLRLAELQANDIDLADYNRDTFAELLPTLRSITLVEDDAAALRLLRDRCAAAGVAVVYVRDVKGSRASGAARWPRPSHPMIVLSGRMGYSDSFWFSFFHEAAHVVLHPKRETYIDIDGDDDDGLETEADRAATRYLIGNHLARQLRHGMRHDDVRRLAAPLGVHPGIVAGQLARATGEWSKYAGLRRKIELPSN